MLAAEFESTRINLLNWQVFPLKGGYNFLPVWELEPNLTLYILLTYIDVGRMCYSRIFTAGPTHCKRGNYKGKGCGLLPESQIIEFSTTRIQWHGLEET